MKRLSRFALVKTAGSFVASENLTVIVSPFPNTASSTGAESAAVIEVIDGPALTPSPLDSQRKQMD